MTPLTTLDWTDRQIATGWRARPVLAALAVTILPGLLVLTMGMNVTPVSVDRIAAAVATAVAFVAIGWCLRWPVPVALIVVGCFGLSFFSAGPAVVAVVAVARRRRPWEIVGVGVVWVAVVAAATLRPLFRPEIERADWWPVAVSLLTLGFVAIYGVCVGVGWYIGSRTARIASLQARAEAIEREQAERIEKARTAERTRIAREMHDVLAHRISLVAIHSGALAYRTDLSPEEVRAAATTVQESAHLALAELRDVLGVLRDSEVEPGAPDRPQPTLATLDDLLTETRQAGTPVSLTVEDATTDLLPTLGVSASRHAYRILQEALTNARKHAPGSAVEIEITGAPGGRLGLVVRNALTSPTGPTHDAASPGLGLVGLAERAALAGGALSADADSGQFTVRAWLPWAT